jgi:cytochrome c oxidase subunit II
VSDPALGTAAGEIASLTRAMTILGTITFLVFLAALAYAVFRRREPQAPLSAEGDPRTIRTILLSGAVVPALVLVPLLFWTMQSLKRLHPDNVTPGLVIEVVARQWWWELRYRDSIVSRSFTTANELHIPTGTRVELRLSSPDVIHSFWVPALQGKTDHIPGKVNITWIKAEAPGTYRGQCAEFCGTQHANMRLLVVAQTPDEFNAWMEQQRAPAAEPADSLAERGRTLFLASGCALCHAVRGTPAGAAAGPDLTHFASRRTIAAGRMENTPANLAGWMGMPAAFKPGTRMPAVQLTSEAFNLIHRYLQQLR